MLDTTSDLISRLLGDTVAQLDIPAPLRLAATQEYERVGNWLADHGDGHSGWTVHPQGSFLLNTVVLPIGRDEYDVDTVCIRDIHKESTSQKLLKREVGEVLTEYAGAHDHLPNRGANPEERNRCWTLQYAPSLRFHLDILPAIPNPESPSTGILITDRKLHQWQFSDPLAFAAWFKRQAQDEFVAKRVALAEAARTAPQAIPEWEVKTTLHRVVQVLKLHRNEFFADDLEARPGSVLVTTLAAHAYQGEQGLYDAVLQAVELMPQYVERDRDGWLVPNPVEPRENFADKWKHDPELATRFFGWLQQVDDDLRAAESTRGLDKVAARLSESFGERPVEKAVGRLGDTYRRTRETGGLRLAPASGLLSTAGAIPVSNHDFDGDGGGN